MEPDNKIPSDVKKMSFKAALEELEGIVRTLKGGECDLDHAIIAIRAELFSDIAKKNLKTLKPALIRF